MTKIYLSANNREQVVTLPFAPLGLEISSAQKNSVFDGLTRGRQVIGTMQPRTVSWSGRFFKTNPRWANPAALSDPMDYVDFFERWREALVPIRLVITDGGRELINIAATVDEFSWQLTKTGDISYSIDLSEYVFVR